MNQTLTVGVVGTGTAGSAIALLLARAGHDVTVFERVDEPSTKGAGIMLQPSGLGVLRRLGLYDEVVGQGSRVAHLLARTREGRVLLDLAYQSLDAELFGLGVHRGVLFEALYGALAHSPAKIRTGVTIERATREERPHLVTDSGERLGPFDLVLACDGARSSVRDHTIDVAKSVTVYPYGALWFIGEDEAGEHRGTLLQTVAGTRDMVGLLPTGHPRFTGGKPLVSLFVSVPQAEVPAIRAAGIAKLRDRVLDLCPTAETVLDQVPDTDHLTFAVYHDVVMSRWHAHRIAFLGDAAHATSPQLGQGANLALCDALALATALEQSRTLEDALGAYTSSRRAHLDYYQLATRWLTPFFQSDLTLLGPLRDLCMPPLSQIAYVRREMVRSMAGTKAGLLWGEYAPA